LLVRLFINIPFLYRNHQKNTSLEKHENATYTPNSTFRWEKFFPCNRPMRFRVRGAEIAGLGYN
jgi:hypothetical protein